MNQQVFPHTSEYLQIMKSQLAIPQISLSTYSKADFNNSPILPSAAVYRMQGAYRPYVAFCGAGDNQMASKKKEKHVFIFF